MILEKRQLTCRCPIFFKKGLAFPFKPIFPPIGNRSKKYGLNRDRKNIPLAQRLVVGI